jgi:hypothetical protein
MKKLLLSIGLSICTLSVMAQVHISQDFLNVKALQPGTNSVGYAGLTNLANQVTGYGQIYSSTNLAYTNNAGAYIHPGLAAVIAAMGTTNQYTTPTLFKDVSLYADRNGNPILYSMVAPGVIGNSNITYLSPNTLFIEIVPSTWTTNGAYGFQFRPIWDGVTANGATNDDWWAILPSSLGVATGGKAHLATNAPTFRWPGAKRLRLVSITNNVTTITAGATTVTNSAFITKLQLNGFIP